MKKICSICNIEKDLSEFYNNYNRKFGKNSECILCNKKNRDNNKEHYKEIARKTVNKNRDKINKKQRIKQRIRRKKNPEYQILATIKTRCKNPNREDSKYYHNKGIICELTIEEIKLLMIRDNYYELKKPSIDRINHNKDYTFDNCQFIEHKENSRKDNIISVIQFDKKKNFLKKWDSITEAKISLRVCHISDCCKGKRKSAGGSIWRYTDDRKKF